MEVAAAAVAFGQAIGVIGVGIKKLRTMQQASVEFMDLLNQLSRFNAQAELLRRALKSLADGEAEVSHLDIDLITSLQGDLCKIGQELDDAAASFIATSRGLDGEGRQKIRKLKWQKEQARLVKLRDRAKELSIEMSSCLTAINMAQGIRQTAMILDVRSFVEVSLGNLSSQLDHHETLLLEGAQSTASQTNHPESKPTVASDEPQLWLSKLAADERQPTEERNVPHTNRQPVVNISSTLRPACPPNCRCQCHVTSRVWSPAWASDALGMLMINYRSLPLLGLSRCDVPLCKAASGSSFRVNYSFPRWAVARYIQISMSWGSLTDDGASIFLKIPRSLDEFYWINAPGVSPTAVLGHLRHGELRPTDILSRYGQTALTMCMEWMSWDWLQVYLQHGFDPAFVDMTGRSAVHWARQYELEGIMDSAPTHIQSTLRQFSSMKLSEDGLTPLSLLHRFFRGMTPMSLKECIQVEPKHVGTVDELGYAPLHWAVLREDLEAVRILIQAGANVNQQTSHDRKTPLLLAFQSPSDKALEFVQLLLESGASPRLASRDGVTPLHLAVRRNQDMEENLNMVRRLLSHGANPRAQTSTFAEPLHIIVELGSMSGMKNLITILIDEGAKLEATNNGGQTPLLTALTDGYFALASVLLGIGADASATDYDGDNWLHTATLSSCRQNSPALLQDFKLIGSNPDAVCKYGRSPLDNLAVRLHGADLLGIVEIWWAVEMVALILAIREANWEAGHFLDKKASLEEDGSHARLAEWVARQKQLMERHPSYRTKIYTSKDIEGWYVSSSCGGTGSEHDADESKSIAGSNDNSDEVFHDAFEAPNTERTEW